MGSDRTNEEFERNRAKGSIKIKKPNPPGKFADLYPEEKAESNPTQAAPEKVEQPSIVRIGESVTIDGVELAPIEGNDPEAGLDNAVAVKVRGAWKLGYFEALKKAEAKTVPDMLRESAATYEERNAIYGDNYKHFGKAMMGVFPNGLTISDEDAWNKLGILIQVVSKVTRIGQSFPDIHDDSCLDISTYAAMLRELGRGSK